MVVVNEHSRDVAPGTGALIDTLASADDRLWPHADWPPMRFDRPLQVGATGGHGPVRYFVEEYEPARRVRFRFTGPAGFDGYHEVAATDARLVHRIVMRTRGAARLTWPLVFRPLHDALIEDALDRAQGVNAEGTSAARWSLYVRVLRWVMTAASRKPAPAPRG